MISQKMTEKLGWGEKKFSQPDQIGENWQFLAYFQGKMNKFQKYSGWEQKKCPQSNFVVIFVILYLYTTF